jgi:LmbE family N-acetylglucosaminyl deacetylase
MMTTGSSPAAAPTAKDSWTELVEAMPVLEMATVGSSALVVAPHPDDETLGCGGLIADLTGAGISVRILVVSDGRASHPVSGMAAVREAEAAQAATILGCDDLVWAGLPDGGLSVLHDEITRWIRRCLPAESCLLMPRFGDGHSDHDAVALAAREVQRSRTPHGPSMTYGVWSFAESPFPRAAHGAVVHVLSETARRAKAAAIDVYVSQTSDMYGDVVVTTDLLTWARGEREVFW